MFGKPPNQRLGFVKFTAEITNSQSASLPGSVFLRGPSVAMLVILTADDNADEKHVLLTVQPRIAAGSLAFVELPAGMVDEEGAFVGSAAKEIKEELGLEIKEDSLKDLTELAGTATGEGGRGNEDLAQAVYPSPGGSDEYVKIFLHERRVPRKQLSEWTGKLTGLRDDGEKITLKLVKMEDLWRAGARDAKCLSALALYNGLKQSGKV
jgi:ADP-sugar diphosphatase